MSKIRSMTGFGRSEIIDGNRKLLVELKAVNHRYLDLGIKMPRKFNGFDNDIRGLLKEYMERGKVDLFISYESSSEEDMNVSYHKDIAAEYMKYFRQMSQDFDIENDIKVSDLAGFPDVITLDAVPVDEEQLWQLLQSGLREAADRFNMAREKEGANLCEDLCAKLDEINEIVEYIKTLEPQIIERYKTELTEKIRDMLDNTAVDEGRVLTEVAIMADKVCIDEEVVRLSSHVKAVKEILSEGGPVGRRLDFLAQEMNRESNTILSKCSNAEIAGKGIQLKTNIEKIREQIQNLE